MEASEARKRDAEKAAALEVYTTAPNTSAPDEILKWKSLLDAGAITQQEYDAKKAQLLSL